MKIQYITNNNGVPITLNRTGEDPVTQTTENITPGIGTPVYATTFEGIQAGDSISIGVGGGANDKVIITNIIED